MSSNHPLPSREDILIAKGDSVDPFMNQDDPPIIILVNLSSSGQEMASDQDEEQDVVGQEVEVVEEQEEVGGSMSPMSILLSAAESSENAVVSSCDYLGEDTTTPLDLSTAHLSKNPDHDFLEFTSVNSGRRRSVFLAEELDFEHQGDMTVVDPVKVTGVNS